MIKPTDLILITPQLFYKGKWVRPGTKKPEPQQWEATFTRAHLQDAVRAEIEKACIDLRKN